MKEQNKKLLSIALIVVGLVLLMGGEDEKQGCGQKESASEWGRVGMGIAGLVIGAGLWFVPGGQVTGTMLAVGSVALIFGGGSLFSGISGLFTPDQTIPSWVWIAGVIVILFMLVSRRKN